DVNDVVVNNGTAFVADGSQGVFLVDPTVLPVPTLISQYQTMAYATGGMQGQGDYFYVGSKKTLAVLSTEKPLLPMMVGSVALSETVRGLTVIGDMAYVALGYEGLAIVDISNPISPTVAGWIDTPGFANDVAVAGNYAYVADFDAGLRIINISQPDSPFEASFFDTAETVYGLEVRNNVAYLADGNGGLRLVSVAVVNNPTEFGFLAVPLSVRDVAVKGSYAYLANGGDGLRIANIVNPAAPFEVGHVSLFGYASRVNVLGGYAYISGENGGLRLVDVNDVTSPVEVAEYNTIGTTLDVGLQKGYAWLADLEGGVFVVTTDLSAAGRVVDHNDVGFNGVVVNGTAERAVASNSNGDYMMTGFLPGATYHLTPTLAGYTFLPPNRSIFMADNVQGQDFVILPEPTSTTVATNTETILSYLDVRGYQTDFAFGPGAVDETTAVTVTPIIPTWSGNMAFAGHAFDLTADQGGGPITTFNRPVTVTIEYSDADVQKVTAENELTLLWWDGSTWVDAAETCSPTTTYTRDLVNNVISIGVCKSGRFGLFGTTDRWYLPAVFKQ
ncbi:MAG: hypothetical protein WAM60_13040, partial [Candidatus Promineifilaceae bacterium]